MTAQATLPPRIAVLGYGAMGQRVAHAIVTELAPTAPLSVVRRSDASLDGLSAPVLTTLPALLAWQPDVVIECAGHGAVVDWVVPLLAHGVDVIVASVGALADAALHAQLKQNAAVSRATLRTVTGAVGALDALSAAAQAGLDTVRYTGRKPPLAWRGTPAEQAFDLANIRTATPIYTGTARQAALAFPKNANVAAAVALAGVGFENTQVQLIADPDVQSNVHELHAHGAFGSFAFSIANAPLPDNPKTSWLAALSVQQELKLYLQTHRLHIRTDRQTKRCC
ncbi:aspartate dehydrogenase [Lampropedia puyangensis]|uniref:L-aspartate dehydrogenase n=1 Tax=Lampropedia puyangensis TaxID=1330072 RepID=A0A4S8FC75_9BURK|nr:aspartate dehydrogenase [Lampropedia puyangensis]THU05160.1 aspartate dehydrogenase [Lampropedia puyangensis]